ncbi:MAG: ParB/RepB/Spo0J family partition protein [Actinomycetota bacterium]|nr:ParB/RepB/Spo0J family partition protein [Actinomycetota bacterium]
MPRRSGLGRGLGALIPTEISTTASNLREIPLSRVRPNQFQPRKQFSEEALASLVDSIRAVGVLQPVLVREHEDGEFELIAGERRCRAARRAGLQTIPALVQSVSDAVSLEQALIENIQREQLNPLDEAAAYQQLIEEFSLTHEEVARRVGRSRASISNALRLFQLPPTVQRLVRDERLSAGHARALLGTPDRELQEALANEVVATGLSVRAVEERVRTAVRGDSVDDVEALEVPALSGDGAGQGSARAPLVATGDPGGGFAAPPTLRPPGVLELEQLLADHLDTRVRVEMGAKHGRVVVEFATLEDLERIYRVMIAGRPS